MPITVSPTGSLLRRNEIPSIGRGDFYLDSWLNSKVGLRPDGTIDPRVTADKMEQEKKADTKGAVDFAGQWADPYAPKVGETTDEVMAAMAKYIPQLYGLVNQNIGTQANAELAAKRVVAPQEAQLAYDLFAQYAPKQQEVENQINADKRLAEASADYRVLRGPGGVKGPGRLLAEEAQFLDKQLNPEWYAQRSALNDKTLELVNGLNPNGLSGGEAAEVERANNIYNSRTGNIGNQSATSVVGNAMGFGDRLNQKKMQIAQIVSGATAGMGQFKNQINPYGRPQDNTASSTQFQPVKPVNTDGSTSMGNNFMNNAFQTANQTKDINAGRRDALDRLFQLTELDSFYS